MKYTEVLAIVYTISLQAAHRAKAAHVALTRRRLTTHLLSPSPGRRRFPSTFCRGLEKELSAGTPVFVVLFVGRHAGRDARS